MNGSLNRKVSSRELRRSLKVAAINSDAALNNESLTRKRVDDCERAIAELATLMARGFWGRLTWLLYGR